MHKVLMLRAVSDTAFVLRITREELSFTPGMYVSLGISSNEVRPYSIYSGINDLYLEFLIKVIPDGNVSLALSQLNYGDDVWVGNLRGHFVLPENANMSKLCLIATGTGIAPFHSYVKSYPELDYQLLHGIRNVFEIYDVESYERDRIIFCSSRDGKGDFNGRVTDYIKQMPLESINHFYICGNYDMIDEVYEILISNGIMKDCIKTEGYY